MKIDVVGIGQNAVDTVLSVDRFPEHGGKVRVISISRQAGGQMATAMVTCQRLGLRARYVGKVGDDSEGKIQLASLRREGVDAREVRAIRGARTQLGLIVVDGATGERTVFWERDPRLALRPGELKNRMLTGAKLLHIDGSDIAASLKAAKWARRAGIRVTADFDTVTPGMARLFPFVNFIVASADFFPALTGETNLTRALEIAMARYRLEAAGATLGCAGAIMMAGGKRYYSPGFVVKGVDTTGAGDVFHGAVIYGLLKGWPMGEILDFSNGMAALNCTANGARGKIAAEADARGFMRRARRCRSREFGRWVTKA